MSESKSLAMPRKVSSKADMSSILYEGRAPISEIADIPAMKDEGWKKRLADGIEAKGLSQREVSLAAGKGPGYVNSLLNEGKDPTINNLLVVCKAAGLSLYSVLYGIEMSRETEEIVRKLEMSSEAKRRGLLQILQDEGDAEGPSV
jgi:transcriptional regulator with XRE-family HTH domain